MSARRARTLVSTALVICGLAALGCAGPGTHDKPAGEFDPLGFPGDDAVVTAGVERPDIEPNASLSAPMYLPSDADADSVSQIRVQFYATTSLTEAEDVLQRASKALSDSVAIEFETPYYKLKAGPLPTEEAAVRLVTKLRRMGYESAWIIRERVATRTGLE